MGSIRMSVQKLLASLIPHGREFFTLLAQSSENAVHAARLLQELCDDFRNLDAKVKAIDEIEDTGDDLTHAIVRQLNASFVTPIMLDREDIIRLSDLIDDIVDFIKATVDHMAMYEIPEPTDHAKQLSGLLLASCEGVNEAVQQLSTLASNADPERIAATVKRVNELENEADEVKRWAAVELFKSTKDPIEIIKWKDIYRYLEDAINLCEDAVNMIEATVVKNV